MSKNKSSKPKQTKGDKSHSALKFTADVALVILGSAIYSFGLHSFIAPANIAPGGVTGIATIISSMTGMSVGTLYGLFNLPLIILGFVFLGKGMMVKTIVSVGVITIATDFVFVTIPVYEGEKILAALFGGVLFGSGIGLINMRSGTSGGIDIVNRIIHKKMPHLSLGKIGVAADAVIIAASMAVFRSVEAGLFAIIAIFVSGRVIDALFYGGFEGKLLLVFSEKYEEITRKIIEEQHRGVTLLHGTGAFSGREKKVICCAARKNQYFKIKRLVAEADPKAFIVITNAGEVLGEGFRANVVL
ncbi:MAG: YitT family protein [Oscillospiraceae bacterium]|nr:YitT family protein [Oscillospiraceae bacterium]